MQADASQLHQVILNLCINARDAIAGAGRINLAARNLETKSPLTTARGFLPAGNYVQLSVSDTGSGMPPAVAEKIFDPFYTTKAPGKGTGLGLSTVATIVRNLQGGIVVQTAPGEGTTFTVYLPAMVAADAAPKTSPARTRDGAGRTILIADDEKAIATIMREVLESADYRTQTVASGREALAATEKSQSALLLLDLMMPGAPGASAVLEKPFSPAQLLTAVQEALRAA